MCALVIILLYVLGFFKIQNINAKGSKPEEAPGHSMSIILKSGLSKALMTQQMDKNWICCTGKAQRRHVGKIS